MALIQSIGSRYTKPVLVAANKPFEDDDKLLSLRQHPLFAELSSEHLDQVLQQSRQIRLGNHQLLYRQDMPAHHFFFVISGRLRLYRLDSSGVDRTLDSLAPGDCFAEVMIYADPPAMPVTPRP